MIDDINDDLKDLEYSFGISGTDNPMHVRVFDKNDDGDYIDPDFGYTIDDRDVEVFVEQKTLTQTELAAEYWKSRLQVAAAGNRDMAEHGHLCEHWKEKHRQLDILSRFTTNPDYTEDLDEN